MTADEASAFGRDPLFEQKLRLRSWDEQGKLAGWAAAPLASYRDLLVAHLNRA
jgi:predicted HD phosphohydrolase